jgi:hypothetical protein
MICKKTSDLCLLTLTALLPTLFTCTALADPVQPPWQSVDIDDVGIAGGARSAAPDALAGDAITSHVGGAATLYA